MLITIPTAILGGLSIHNTWKEDRPDPCGKWADLGNGFLALFYPNIYLFHNTSRLCHSYSGRIVEPPYGPPCDVCSEDQYHTELIYEGDALGDPDVVYIEEPDFEKSTGEVRKDVGSHTHVKKCTPVQGLGGAEFFGKAIDPLTYIMGRIWGAEGVKQRDTIGAHSLLPNQDLFPGQNHVSPVAYTAARNITAPKTYLLRDGNLVAPDGRYFIPPLIVEEEKKTIPGGGYIATGKDNQVHLDDPQSLSFYNSALSYFGMTSEHVKHLETETDVRNYAAAFMYNRGLKGVDYTHVADDPELFTAYASKFPDSTSPEDGHKVNPAPLQYGAIGDYSGDYLQYIEQNLMTDGPFTFQPVY